MAVDGARESGAVSCEPCRQQAFAMELQRSETAMQSCVHCQFIRHRRETPEKLSSSRDSSSFTKSDDQFAHRRILLILEQHSENVRTKRQTKKHNNCAQPLHLSHPTHLHLFGGELFCTLGRGVLCCCCCCCCCFVRLTKKRPTSLSGSFLLQIAGTKGFFTSVDIHLLMRAGWLRLTDTACAAL